VSTDSEQRYCYLHDRLESAVLGESVICTECGHVYPTEAQLVADFRAFQKEGTVRWYQRLWERVKRLSGPRRAPAIPTFLVDDAKNVPFCPHCLHDF
jgi:hypothetical protein